MEITISEPIVEKVLDSCVGVDEKRYYKVQWLPTWEPEEEVLCKYQHLVEEFWKDANLNAQKTIEQQQQTENGIVNQLDVTKSEASKLPTPSIERKKGCEIRPFKCDQCVRSFPSDQKLKEHKRKLHSDLQTFPCPECSKTFTSQKNLQQHMLRHTGTGPLVCHGCSKRFMLTQELEAHARICENLVVKDFQCDICSKRFTTKTHLQFHMKIHLPDSEKPFTCQYCPRTFAYKHDCVHHMRLHIGEKPFKCAECDAAFHRKSYLTEHMFVHTGISKYRCDECMEYFKTQRILQTHVKNIHILKKKPLSEEDKQKQAKKKKKKQSKKVHECEECGKEFKFLKEYHYHKVVNHKDELRGKQESIELTAFEPTMVYKCKTCEKTFNWPTSLKKHADTHRMDNLVGKYIEVVETSGGDKDKENGDPSIVGNVTVDNQVVVMNQVGSDEIEISEQIKEDGSGSILLMVQQNYTQTEDGLFACTNCALKFEDEVNLNVHVLEHHRTNDLTEQVRSLIEEVGGVEQVATIDVDEKTAATVVTTTAESEDEEMEEEEMSEEEIEDHEDGVLMGQVDHGQQEEGQETVEHVVEASVTTQQREGQEVKEEEGVVLEAT